MHNDKEAAYFLRCDKFCRMKFVTALVETTYFLKGGMNEMTHFWDFPAFYSLISSLSSPYAFVQNCGQRSRARFGEMIFFCSAVCEASSFDAKKSFIVTWSARLFMHLQNLPLIQPGKRPQKSEKVVLLSINNATQLSSYGTLLPYSNMNVSCVIRKV